MRAGGGARGTVPAQPTIATVPAMSAASTDAGRARLANSRVEDESCRALAAPGATDATAAARATIAALTAARSGGAGVNAVQPAAALPTVAASAAGTAIAALAEDRTAGAAQVVVRVVREVVDTQALDR